MYPLLNLTALDSALGQSVCYPSSPSFLGYSHNVTQQRAYRDRCLLRVQLSVDLVRVNDTITIQVVPVKNINKTNHPQRLSVRPDVPLEPIDPDFWSPSTSLGHETSILVKGHITRAIHIDRPQDVRSRLGHRG